MDRRLSLHNKFLSLVPNVYFQPPATVQMVYPAIVYDLDNVDVKFADNRPYGRKKRYQVTIIDRRSTSDIPDKIADFQLVRFIRAFTKDGLNHTIFNLYF